MSKAFTIKKNKHTSGLHFSLHSGKTFDQKEIMFSDNCWYTITNNDSYDINKLFGFSHGYHHKNSVRFGWLPDFDEKNSIQIWSYTYNNSKRDFNKICNIKTRHWYVYKILCKNEKVIFSIEDKQTNSELGNFVCYYKVPDFDWGYNLFPYFGGDNKSPQEMIILST